MRASDFEQRNKTHAVEVVGKNIISKVAGSHPDSSYTFSVRLKNPSRLRTAPLVAPTESWIKCTVGHQEADAGQRFAPNVAWLNQSKLDSSAFCLLSQ